MLTGYADLVNEKYGAAYEVTFDDGKIHNIVITDKEIDFPIAFEHYEMALGYMMAAEHIFAKMKGDEDGQN